MPDFPLPSFGPHIEDILGYALDLLNLYDEQRFLWVMAGLSLAVLVIGWAISTIKRPPRLDI